jgi:hypothetical protein
MPSLYSNSSTTYVVTASNVSTLYLGTTGTVITATTFSTNLAGLYGGTYAGVPTTAEQLIQFFDNSGNVDFFLNTLTNNTTIFATTTASGTGTVSIGNYAFVNNTISNTANANIDLTTNGRHWYFNSTGTITLPGGGTIGDTYGQGVQNVQIQPGPGAGGYAGINSYDQKQYVVATDSDVQIGTNWPGAGAKEWYFRQDGTTQFPNYTFPATNGTYGQVLSWPTSGSTLTWTTGTNSGVPNQVFDFGSFLVPVSFTLDMGAFI